MSETSVAIVIPYYRGHRYIKKLIESVEQNARSDIEIIVVDNGPLNDRLNQQSVYEDISEQIQLIEGKPQLGFGRACNLGVFTAYRQHIKYTCIINQDAYFFPDALVKLIQGLKETNAALVGPIQVEPSSNQVSPFVARLYVPELLNADLTVQPLSTLPTFPREISDFLSGACIFGLTQKLYEYGPFDPMFTMYGEDNDLSSRVKKNNECLFLIRDAYIAHHHSNATAELNDADRKRMNIWKHEAVGLRHLVQQTLSVRSVSKYLARRGRTWISFMRRTPSLDTLNALLESEIRLTRNISRHHNSLLDNSTSKRARDQIANDHM